ncbi:hypothetical protein [Antarctobacter jejuensis]|uniref:hypothetical protein n=1 Tax=Antarctobacter jejuensis TaxID=1439938 RepID=UPI003FD40F06
MFHPSQPQPKAPNLKDLSAHLAGAEVTARKALAAGLTPMAGRYSWRQVWRRIHGIDSAQLPHHLLELQARHPASPILNEINNLEEALKEPLWKFPAMARALGQTPDTLSKALRQGRATLPFPVISFGQMRLYRPLDVRLWGQEGLLLDLPRYAEAPSPAPASRASKAQPGPATAGEKALFQPLFPQPRTKSE